MSSTYSGDHVDGVSTRGVSTKSIGQAIQWTREWIANDLDKSIASSPRSSSSDRSSTPDDLDLDSLFKRLDKYTTEMQEVEDRLKLARSNSEKSNGVNAMRFSFEDQGAREDEEPSNLSRTSATASRQKQSIHTGLNQDKDPGRIGSPRHSTRSSRASVRHNLPVHSHSERVSTTDDAQHDAFPDLQMQSPPQKGEKDVDSPARRVFGNWNAWAEQKFDFPQSTQERSSSRYSARAESLRDTSTHNFLWKRMSPTPPLKDMRRTPTLRKARVSDPVTESSVQSAHDYHDSEDDTPGPSVTSSWVLPPRNSSRRVMSNDSLPPRTSSRRVISDEIVQDQDQDFIPPRPAPRRRMTTSEGRTSIRNGGFWSDHSADMFRDEDVPPVPSLSASNSNATLTMTPPLTPLTMNDEDQLRRELETFSIQDGVEALEHRYKKRRPPMLNLLDSDEDKDDFTPVPTPMEQQDHQSLFSQDDDRSLRPQRRRRKSIFSIFQRKSPVEKLIDMYFDDEPEEKPLRRRRSTWSRKASPVQEQIPKSPAIPAEFQSHGKQTSL